MIVVSEGAKSILIMTLSSSFINVGIAVSKRIISFQKLSCFFVLFLLAQCISVVLLIVVENGLQQRLIALLEAGIHLISFTFALISADHEIILALFHPTFHHFDIFDDFPLDFVETFIVRRSILLIFFIASDLFLNDSLHSQVMHGSKSFFYSLVNFCKDILLFCHN